MVPTVLFPFYGQGNWDTERVRTFAEVPELRMQSQAVLDQNVCCWPAGGPASFPVGKGMSGNLPLTREGRAGDWHPSQLVSWNESHDVMSHSPLCTAKCRTENPEGFLFIFLTYVLLARGLACYLLQSYLLIFLMFVLCSLGGGGGRRKKCFNPPHPTECFCFFLPGAADHWNCDKTPFWALKMV